MTTATDRMETRVGQDFESTVTFTASPTDVLAALRTPEAISSWWCPGLGLRPRRRHARNGLPAGGSKMLNLRVESSEEGGRIVWSVLHTPLTPEWVGTTIVFEIEAAGGGTALRFRHRGLTAQCDCFDMCREGWTNALDRLVSFVEAGQVAYPRDSFHSTQSVTAAPEAVLAALNRQPRRWRPGGDRPRARQTWEACSPCRSWAGASGSSWRSSPPSRTGSCGPSRSAL